MKILESIKAYMRGDKRVKGAVRGRVYTNPDKAPMGTVSTITDKEIRIAVKVTRKSEETV